MLKRIVLSVCAALAAAVVAQAGTYTWIGGSTTWATLASWSVNGDAAEKLPGEEDDVIIPAPESGALNITASTRFSVKSLRIGATNETAQGTVKVTFDVGVTTNVVFGDMHLLRGATLTHAANKYTSSGSGVAYEKKWTVTGRFSLAVGGDMAIDDGAFINVSGCGYKNGAGPGGKTTGTTTTGETFKDADYGAGSYGGHSHRKNNYPACYGCIRAPLDYGSGGQAQYGGGSVNLVVGKDLTVNGVIRSNANDGGNGGGAGGSVFLTVGTLKGAGIIEANGSPQGRAGSGGRISIVEKIATEPQFTGRVDCLGYATSKDTVGANGTIYRQNASDEPGRGTLLVQSQTYADANHQTELTASTMPDVNEPFGAVIVEKNAGLRIFAGTTCTVTRAFSIATAQGATFTADVGSCLKFIDAGCDACVTGALTLAGLECTEPGKRVVFTPGTAGKIGLKADGKMTMRGTADEPVELWGADGAEWLLNRDANAAVDIMHVSVTNCNANAGGSVLAISSNDLGGNGNWSFQDPILPGAVITWTGAADSDWSTKENWSPVRAPLETDDVRILSSGVSRFPVLNGVKMSVNKLTVGADASLTLNGCTVDVTNALEVAGTLTVGGETVVTCLNELNLEHADFQAGKGSIFRLAGRASQAVHLGGHQFHRFEIEKGAGDVTFGSGFAADVLDVKTTGPVTLAFAPGETVTAMEAYVRGCTNGTEGTLHPLMLRSASPGTAWKLSTTDMQFFAWVDVEDAQALGSPVQADGASRDGGTNSGWLFGGRAAEWTGAAGTTDFAAAGNWYPFDAAPDVNTRTLVTARRGETKTVKASSAASVSNLIVGAGLGRASFTADKPLTVNGTLVVATNGTLTLNSPVAPNRVVRDVFLRAGGVLGHDALPGKVTNMAQVDASGYRLMLEVGGNVSVAKGATVNANARGFAAGLGPLPGTTSVSAANASRIVSEAGYLAMTGYGSMFEPLAPGSGGAQGSGGGVIRILANGDMRVDGLVDAGASYMSNYGDAGAGGSVWLTCGGEFSGTGRVNASGGYVSRRTAPGGGFLTVEYGSTNSFTGVLIAAGGCGKNAATSYPGPGIVLERKLGEAPFSVTLDQTLEYVYGTTEATRNVYASSANMRSTLTDLPQRLDAHDLRRYRDMSVTCGMISAFNLTTNLEISDLHFTAPTGSIVRLNGFTLTIRSPKHKNGRGWAVPNAATDPVAQHVVYADEGFPGKIQWKAPGFMVLVR